MAADKNEHILTHFSKENCVKCDQNLIRIGENLYVLHSTVTCIETKLKRKKSKKSKESINVEYTKKNTDETIENAKFDCDGFDDFEVKQENEDSANSLVEPGIVEVNVSKEELNEKVDIKNNHNNPQATIVNTEERNQNLYDNLRNKNEKIQSKVCETVDKLKRKKRDKINDIFFKCDYDGCDKLIRHTSRRQHMTTHTAERFECDICHSSLASKNGLRAHFYLHYPKKDLTCPICNSTYRSESSLSQHVRFVHNKEPKKFICNICGHTLRKSHLLREHMNKHIGTKPYECPHDGCEKRFYTKTHRNEHIRSHTGEKPFKCSEEGCDRQFAYAIDFKRHKFKAHGIYINKFSCAICSKIFPENMLLKKHLKSHEIHDS